MTSPPPPMLYFPRSLPKPILVVTPATPTFKDSFLQQQRKQREYFSLSEPPKTCSSPQVSITEISTTPLTAIPAASPLGIASSLPQAAPPTAVSNLPSLVNKPVFQPKAKSKRLRVLHRPFSRTARNAPPLYDRREKPMARYGNLRPNWRPPVYVPFRTPKPVAPETRYGAAEWGGLRFEPYGISTEELLSTRIVKADARARALRDRNTAPEMTELHSAVEEEQGAPRNGPPLQRRESLPYSFRMLSRESREASIPLSDEAELPSADLEPAEPLHPPKDDLIFTRVTKTLLPIFRYFLTPLLSVLTFIIAPIQRYYHDWDAHRGPLGSHNTQTGRWLRKTRMWKGFEEFRTGRVTDYASEFGLAYGCAHSDGPVSEGERLGLISNGGGFGDEAGRRIWGRDGYGTFAKAVPTSREAMRANATGGVVSWEEGGLPLM